MASKMVSKKGDQNGVQKKSCFYVQKIRAKNRRNGSYRALSGGNFSLIGFPMRYLSAEI